MTDQEKLTILKKDLQRLTNSNDDYLKILMQQAKAQIEREGVDTSGGIEGDMAVIQYAAYLFRKRASGDTAMPRYLRLQLNNMKVSKAGKGESGDV